MDRAPPLESATPHSGVTLYTPESLRQWRLARQQKQQQQLQSRLVAGETAAETSVEATSLLVLEAMEASASSRVTENQGDEQPSRTPSQRHSPYARSSTSSTRSPLAAQRSTGRGAVDATTRVGGVKSEPSEHWSSVAEHNEETKDNQHDADKVTVLTIHGVTANGSDSLKTTLDESAVELPPEHPPTCRISWCTEAPKRHGLCWTHGGEKKCCRVDCGGAATHGDFCDYHHERLGR